MLIPFSFDAEDSRFDYDGHFIVIGGLEYTDIFGASHKEPFSFRSPEGYFMPLLNHEFPLTLAAFSPLKMLEMIDDAED